MGKHDKTIEVSSEEFVRNENKALRKKLAEKDAELAFANETIGKLQKQCGNLSKRASEIEANAKEISDTKDEYIKSLEQTIVELAVRRTDV